MWSLETLIVAVGAKFGSYNQLNLCKANNKQHLVSADMIVHLDR